MKNNKALIIICVILLNVLVVYMIGQNLLGKTSVYDETIAEARTLAEKDLCSKSIEKYNEAAIIKDSLDLRLEMLAVYDKGIEIGEFTNVYEIVNAITTMVDDFRTDVKCYEAACEFLVKYNKFQECADILMQARDLLVSSDRIEEYRSMVRYKYTKFFSMYTEILPSYNGMYAIKTKDGYAYLNEDGSPEIGGTFIYASSFSEGYAFVKSHQPDGKDRSFIINKEGERQVYLDNVESSSGVGKGKNASGEAIYLLSCKIGDRYKYYDINGNEAFGDYAFAGRFRNNVAAVMVSEGNWKLIDGTGNAISDITFSDVVLNEFDECAPKGFIIAKNGDKYHIYDLSANQIGDFACDGAKAFVDEFAAFKDGELWGFVDTEGNVIIEPQYQDAKSFSCSMGAVKTPMGWSLINPDNKVVVEEVFDDVDYLNSKGVCFVKSGDYWSYLKMYYTGK